MHHSGPNTGISPSAHDMAPGDRHRQVAPRTEPRKDRAVHLNCKEAELARQRSPRAAQQRAVWRCSRRTSSSSTRPESLTTRSYCALLATSGHSTKPHNHGPPFYGRSAPVAARDRELLRRPRASRHRTPSVAVARNNSPSLPYPPCPMLSARFQSRQPASVRTHPRSSPHCHAVASSPDVKVTECLVRTIRIHRTPLPPRPDIADRTVLPMLDPAIPTAVLLRSSERHLREIPIHVPRHFPKTLTAMPANSTTNSELVRRSAAFAFSST